MNISNKIIDILIAVSSLILITFCTACEKKIETRNKPEYGQDAVTITDDIDQYNNHNNYYKGRREEDEKRKADFQRSRKIKKRLEDGTLSEKYSGE